jgi:hypothetical protein
MARAVFRAGSETAPLFIKSDAFLESATQAGTIYPS